MAVSRDVTDVITERAAILDILGVEVRLGPQHLSEPPEDTQLVVTSPGVPPHDPLMLAATTRGVPIWGEVELAWRMRPLDGAAPWLTVTGTNGKTTTVNMLASILRSSGLRDVGRQRRHADPRGGPAPEPYDVLAVELSSFQLHWQRSVSAVASAVLNVAPTISTGTARTPSTCERREDLRQHPPRLRLQRRRHPDRAARHGGRGRRGLPGDRLHDRDPAPSMIGSSTMSSPIRPSSSSDSTRRRSCAPWTTCAATRRRCRPLPRQRAGRSGARPGLRRGTDRGA